MSQALVAEGNRVAEIIGNRIQDGETLDGLGRPRSGLPLGLEDGVLGVVGSPATGFTVVVDDTVTDPSALRQDLRSLVPAHLVSMVVVEESCVSAEELSAAWRALSARNWHPQAHELTYAFALDPSTETIVMEIPYDTDQDVLAAVEAVAPRLVTFEFNDVARTDRYNDTPNGGHWGGAAINSGPVSCTAGFSVIQNSNGQGASVTAGHCGNNGSTWYSGPHYYGYMTAKYNFPDYDQALLIGSAYGPHIWTDGPGDSEDVRRVTGAADPAVGQFICGSGMVTTSICGLRVESVSATFCDQAGCTTYLIRASHKARATTGGDSGGPLYTRPAYNSATIRGMIIAGGWQVLYGERYRSIAGHLGVRIML